MPTSFEKNGVTFKEGDGILLRSSGPKELPYVARIDEIKAPSKKGKRDEYDLRVTWYYRPEDVGRRHLLETAPTSFLLQYSFDGTLTHINPISQTYHGSREIFLSDHTDTVSSDTIISKCRVLDVEDYRVLTTVSNTDFYWRYTYHTSTKRFTPEKVPVYCSCGLPENLDMFMAECDKCLHWFHPRCEGIDDEAEVVASRKFLCRKCRRNVPNH